MTSDQKPAAGDQKPAAGDQKPAAGDQKSAAGDQKSAAGNWQRMRFKKNKVWMAVDAQGQPVIKAGKVLIKYQLKQDYEYWVKKENVTSLESPEPETARLSGKTSGHELTKFKAPNEPVFSEDTSEDTSAEDPIRVYTDGASSGNPGPSGIGVMLRYGEHEKKISQFIGNATNNIAELKAIEVGLSSLKNKNIPVRLFTDSKYAYGLLVLNWKPRKNVRLVESIKKTMATFRDVKIIKVKGHSGHPGNEAADHLATSAIKKGRQ